MKKLILICACLLSLALRAQEKDKGITTPVEFGGGLTSFHDNKLYLQWYTESEKDNSHFVIRRSEDRGVSWKEVGRVEGYGTTKVRQHYTWIESKELTGETYYRLVQFDLNGTEHELTLIYYDYAGSNYNGIRLNGKILSIRKVEENGSDDIVIITTDRQVYKVMSIYK